MDELPTLNPLKEGQNNPSLSLYELFEQFLLEQRQTFPLLPPPPMATPQKEAELPTVATKPPHLVEYIPTDVTLEDLGFFTPSSKCIKHISIKEKVLTPL